MGTRRLFWFRETAAESKAVTVATERGAESLADRLAAARLSVPAALRYTVSAAEALREVHNRGRIYQFLQPAAILMLEGGVGLAPAAAVPISPYFSPEQVSGRDLDIRTDIFSLGAVAYEMFAGRKAFDAATRPGLRMEILTREPAPLIGVPAPVAKLIGRCLEKSPERRIQRMEILLAELKLQLILTMRKPD